MGTSVDKLEERRKRLWPRYRVAWWDDRNQAWHEESKLYYDRSAVKLVACDLKLRHTRVRICTIQADGNKADTLLGDFV